MMISVINTIYDTSIYPYIPIIKAKIAPKLQYYIQQNIDSSYTYSVMSNVINACRNKLELT